MITINTKLNSGIYQSEGGGEIRTHYSFNTNPRNLLKACKLLGEHMSTMKEAYGNIGCGSSWLEIDGQWIHQTDIATVTSIKNAAELLGEVAAGYDENKYNGNFDY
ncbi:hypothetical protein OCF84_21330 (plasmid) [Shewanella xiamenensis]|uniref:Uncharacterized protein n=1 Tax=Shewanella xiamenensis TaxID=332186 RepID=A0ABT6UDN3_9GAMM|nr:hypothetical protein [Shewanella xiamenensis]MDI5832580.1 hypothetical protein [Shewanella xiamenensis]WHF57802.1 hypothetical protein OCF84_21330 [Shewanella xiamenensis]